MVSELKHTGLALISILNAVILFKLLQATHYIPNPQKVFVEITLGKLVGVTALSREGRVYNSFTGVPYAKPPTGEVRFKSPVRVAPWSGIIDATKSSPDCLQIEPTLKTRNGQEDCLYLNVYSPQEDITNTEFKSKLRPVIAYIPGGHYMFGGSAILGPQYFMDEDVVLVTMNYRLGALGFLNTGDGTITGNMGLRDQALALEWIQENIHHFGGNKDSVTLMGSSAGGSSAQLHMLSETSHGLFHKAISHSGSSLSPWGFTRNPREQAKRLGLRIGCLFDDSKLLLACLQNKLAEEIVELQRETLDIFHVPEAIYSPSVESANQAEPIFLKDSPYDLLKAGKFSKIPWITGVTSDEGCYRAPYLLNSPEKLHQWNNNFNDVSKNFFLLHDGFSDRIPQKIRKFYFSDASTDIGMNLMQNITNALSDRLFISGVKDAAALHAKHAPTFLYYFSYKGDLSVAPILKATAKNGIFAFLIDLFTGIVKDKVFRFFGWDVVDYGVCHVDCQFQFFQFHPLLRISSSSKHFEFSRSLIRLWVKFAGTSTEKLRTPELNFNGVDWIPIKPTGPLKYLNFKNEGSDMIEEPFTERLEFWRSLNLPQN